MKALDAWDYVQKTTFEEADFIETFLDILRSAKANPAGKAPAADGQELQLDPLRQNTAIWRGQRVNLPLTAQRILAALHDGAPLPALLQAGQQGWVAVFELLRDGQQDHILGRAVAREGIQLAGGFRLRGFLQGGDQRMRNSVRGGSCGSSRVSKGARPPGLTACQASHSR